MRDPDPSLREYIENAVLPCYESFDGAHGPEHVRTVIENSLELAESLDVDINMVYAIAAYHDTGLRFGRSDHELTSGKVFMDDSRTLQWFSPEQRIIMREAIEDHRASSRSEPRSIYGRIISEADRDIEPERIVRRAVEYGSDHFPSADIQWRVSRAIAHIEEKYGENGYLRLWLPCRKNMEGLAKLREWLKTGEIENICRKYV